MGGSRSHSEFCFVGKSSQNCSKPVLIFWSSIQCLYNYTLLKVVNYYDLSVMSMSVLGFQKKIGWGVGGWLGGWGELHPSLFLIFFNFASPLHCQPMNRSISLGVCANRIVLCEIRSFIYCN